MRKLLVVLVLLLQASCASKYSKVNELISSKADVQRVTLVFSTQEDKLRIRVPRSNTGFALLGAPGIIVDIGVANGRNRHNRGFLFPINKELKWRDLSRQIRSSVRDKVKLIDWLFISKELSIDELESEKLPKKTHVLFIDYKYEFTPLVDSIEVTVIAKLKRLDSARKHRMKSKRNRYETIFENRYKYVSPLANPFVKVEGKHSKKEYYLDENTKVVKRVSSPTLRRELMLNYWSNNESQLVKQYLESGFEILGELIHQDLTVNYKNESEELSRYNQFYWLMSEQEERVFLKSSLWPNAGSLCSIPRQLETHRCTDSPHALDD